MDSIAFYDIQNEDEIAKQQPEQHAKCSKTFMNDECEGIDSNGRSAGIRGSAQ